jgi:uncharacterized membrane protein
MSRLARIFPEAARREIEDAIHRAEEDTQAEIVVAAAGSSGRYDRPEDITGLIVAVLLLGLLSVFAPQEFHFAAVCTVLFVGFFAGAGLAMVCPPLRRLLTPRSEMLEETTRAAESLFYRSEIRRAPSRCGVLIYISFFEHTASVIADTRVLEKLGQEGIDRLCFQLTQKLHGGPPDKAVVQVVEEAGRELALALPRQEGQEQELPNHFILLD